MLVFGAALLAGTIHAEEPQATKGILPVPDYTGDVWTRSYLAGDFNGGRTALANKGIQLDVDWTQYAQSIVQGGRDSDSHYGGHLDYLFHFDLMKMGVLPGALVTVRAETRYGQSVNGTAGPLLPVNTTAFFPLTDQLDDNVSLAVTDLNFTQFLSENLAVTVGKIDTLDADLNEFASGRGKSQFMSAEFLFDPVVALRLPYSTLGAGFLFLPNKNVTVTGSIINTQDASQTSGFEGFGNGVSLSGEVDTQYHLGNLPGGFNVGGLYSFDQDFTQVQGLLIFQPGQGLEVNKKDSTWAVYSSFWQYLYVADPNDKPIDLHNGEPDHHGFGLFGRLGFADQDTNPNRWSASVGVGGEGMVPTREHDTFGVGYYYTKIDESRLIGGLGVQDKAQGAEAFYNVALTPAAHLTFDAQLQDPALPHVDSAVILGMRLNLSF
jgi:porin